MSQKTKGSSISLVVRSFNRLSPAYIKKLKGYTLGNKYISMMTSTIDEMPWLSFKDKYYALILKKNDVIIGWSLLDLSCKHLNIYVNNNYRRKGYGSLLLMYSRRFASKRKVKFLEIFPHNQVSFKFFNSNDPIMFKGKPNKVRC